MKKIKEIEKKTKTKNKKQNKKLTPSKSQFRGGL
jgi:hypothetical protein